MGVRKLKNLINDSMNNEVPLKRNNNESLNNDTRVKHADYIADKLVKIYGAPGSRNFFLKCAWHLSENAIWTAVENSQKKTIRCPVRYFVAICNKAMNC